MPPSYMTVSAMPLSVMGAPARSVGRKKQGYTDQDYEESRRRYGAYLRDAIKSNQKYGSILTDDDVRNLADSKLEQDGLPTSREVQERADIASIQLTPVERFATRAERAQRATIDSVRRGVNLDSQYMRALDLTADKATAESSGLLEDFGAEGLGVVSDPVWLGAYGAGRALQVGKFARLGRWQGEVVKDSIAEFGAGVATGGLQTGGDIPETLKIATTGAIFAGAGGIVLRGLAKTLRIASPNITPEKIMADARRAVLRDPEAIATINKLRQEGVAPRDAEARVLAGVEDELARALDPEQGLVRGMLDAKREGGRTFDNYVKQLEEANAAEIRGLGAELDKAIYDIGYQRAGTRVAENLENQRILRSELEARKADAAADDPMAPIRRAREIVPDEVIRESKAIRQADQDAALGKLGAELYAVRKAAGKQADLLNKANDIDAKVPSTQVDKFRAREAKTAALRGEAPRVDGARPEVDADVAVREVAEEVRAEALKDPDILDEIAELESAGFTREQAEALTVFGEAPKPEAKPVKVGDAPQAKVEGMEEAAQSPKAEVGGGAAKTHQLRGNPNPGNIKKIYESEAPAVGDELLTPGGNSWRVESVAPSDIPSSRSKAKTKITIGHESGRKIEVYTEADWTKPPTAPGEQLTLGFQSGISPQVLDDMVAGALKAGQWAKPHVVAGARWAMDTAGDAIRSMRDFAQVMIDKFGRAIRKHIPEMWERFKKMQAQRAELRARTEMRRSRGAIDLRGRVTKGDQAKIESAQRKAIREQERAARQERQANRAEAVDAVKEELPKEVQGRFLKRVTEASTPRRVDKIRSQAADVRAKLDDQLAAESVRKEIGKIVTEKKTGAINKAARNSDFNDDFNRIHAMGVKNPRKGPTNAEVRNMSPRQRAELYKAYADLQAKHISYMGLADDAAKVQEASRAIAADIAAKGRAEVDPKTGAIRDRNVGLTKQFLREESLQPERLVGRLGSAAQAAIYEPLAQASGRYYKAIKGFNQELTDRLKAAGIDDPNSAKWLRSVSGTRAEVIPVKMGDETVDMTRGQYWALLANLSDSSTANLIRGGAPISLANDSTRKISLTDEAVSDIIDAASESDLAIVAAFKDIMNGSAKSRMNEAWKKLKGFELAEGDDYFPRMRDSTNTIDDIEAIMQPVQTGKLENRSFTKERSHDTDAPVVIGDIFSTADRHFSQVAAVSEMADDIRKIRGITEGREFKDAVTKSYGESMHKAINRWVQEVAEDMGSYRKPLTPAQVGVGRIVSNIGVGVLGANPWVVLKQLPSFANAMTEIDAGLMIKAAREAVLPGSEWKAIRRRMREHSPRIWARYEVHASRLIGDMRDAPAAVARTKDLSDKFMVGISFADENVIASIWRASEMKVEAEFPNLKDDAYWDKVNELSDRVIRRTQPNFDPINSSSIQRKGRSDPFMKAASMFMSQRNTNYNMLYEAIASKNTKRLAAVLGVVAVAQPLMISSVDEFRDWVYGRGGHESGKDLAIALSTDVVANNLSQIYFAGALLDPASRQVSKAVTGSGGYVFSPSNPITSTGVGVYEGIAKAIAKTKDGDWEGAWDGFERAMLSSAALSGIPIRTPWRLAEEMMEGYENYTEPPTPE